MNTLERELKDLAARGLRRELRIDSGIDFHSNDYLGLSRSEHVRAAVQRALADCALGSTGSRLVSGESEAARAFEAFLVERFQAPAALFFGSGYLANLGVLVALGGEDGAFFSDQFNHASLIDGMRLARGPVDVFPHNDLDALEAQLRRSRARRKVIVTESVFSMDGDSPDLAALAALAARHGAFVVLDEAHATGVDGGGRGRGFAAGFDPERTIFTHACGKAYGAYGAFVLADARVRELMIHKARTFVFSTAPPPLWLAQLRAAIDEAFTGSARTRLAANRDHLAQRLRQEVPSAIVPIRISGNERVLSAAEKLCARGLNVRAIRYPTVAAGSERLRLTLKSFHTLADLDRLAEGLQEVVA